MVLEDETEKGKKVDFSLYTNQWDCLLNVPFSGIIIIIIIIITKHRIDHKGKRLLKKATLRGIGDVRRKGPVRLNELSLNFRRK